MSKDGKKTGGCLCGAVRFTVDKAIETFGACHCKMCRTWSSGPFLATECGSNVHFEAKDKIQRYQSSEWAERGFCQTCGSNLFYRLTPDGEYYMAVGAFDDQNGLKMEHQVFIDEKPDGYEFANESRILTGAEVFALYAPKD